MKNEIIEKKKEQIRCQKTGVTLIICKGAESNGGKKVGVVRRKMTSSLKVKFPLITASSPPSSSALTLFVKIIGVAKVFVAAAIEEQIPHDTKSFRRMGRR